MKGYFIDDTPGEGWLPNSERARYAIAPHFNVVARYEVAPDALTNVRRDPCPMCGVRGDVGCKHKRAV